MQKRTLVAAIRILGCALALQACRQESADVPTEPPSKTIELHNAGGTPRLVVDVYSDHLRWREPGGAQGKLKVQGASIATVPAADEDAVTAWSPDGDAKYVVRNGEAVQWDIKRVDGLLRVGDDKGFPRARISRDPDKALLHDAGGQLLVMAQSDGGRIVVTDRDEAVKGYVVGSVDVERAALLFVPDLSSEQRALVLAAPRLP